MNKIKFWESECYLKSLIMNESFSVVATHFLPLEIVRLFSKAPHFKMQKGSNSGTTFLFKPVPALPDSSADASL